MTALRNLLLACAVAGCAPLLAQSSAQAGPDFAEFSGAGGLVFAADARLNPGRTAAVEFWVEPEWTGDLGYEPVILSNTGPQGALYYVAVLSARDGLSVVAGENEAIVAFDFTDGVAHHVAINSYEDGLVVFIDGEPRGVFDFAFAELPSYGLFVGTSDGTNGAFVGAVGQLRIWDAALEEDEIRRFATRPLVSPESGDHPNVEALLAVSDFANRDLLLVDALAVNTPE